MPGISWLLSCRQITKVNTQLAYLTSDWIFYNYLKIVIDGIIAAFFKIGHQLLQIRSVLKQSTWINGSRGRPERKCNIAFWISTILFGKALTYRAQQHILLWTANCNKIVKKIKIVLVYLSRIWIYRWTRECFLTGCKIAGNCSCRTYPRKDLVLVLCACSNGSLSVIGIFVTKSKFCSLNFVLTQF